MCEAVEKRIKEVEAEFKQHQETISKIQVRMMQLQGAFAELQKLKEAEEPKVVEGECEEVLSEPRSVA